MAITTFTGDLSAQFAAGTSLEARPASNWPAAKRPPEAGTTPVGAATATATSNSAGVLSLTGLADSTEYYVSDAAGTRYVRITTFPERQEVMSNQADQANGFPRLDANAKVPWSDLAGSPANVLDKAYGGIADAVNTTGSITAANNQLTLTSGGFTAADVGKVVLIGGAGATINLGASGGGTAVPRPFKAWISAVAGGVATLVTAKGGSTAANATTSQTGTAVTYGTNLYDALVLALATGRAVEVPAGDYICVGSLTGQLKRLYGAGHATRIYVSPDFTNFTPDYGTAGLTGSSRTLGSNAALGDTSVVLSSALGTISPGDVLFLSSTAVWEPGGTDSDATATKKGEFVRVQQVSGTTVYLEAPLADSYLTADTAKVQAFSFADGVDVSQINFINATPNVYTPSASSPWSLAQYGGFGALFSLTRFKHINIERLQLEGLSTASVFMMNCIDFDVSRIKTRESSRLGSFGYTVSLFASQWGEVTHCRSRRSSSLFNAEGVLSTVAGDANLPTRWVEVRDCVSYEGQHEPFLCHVTSEFIDFVNCKVYGGSFWTTESSHSSGFRVRGRNCKLIRPLAERVPGISIVIGGKNCEIHEPIIRKVSPDGGTNCWGIELGGNNPGAVGTIIRDPDIDGVAQTATNTGGYGIIIGDGATGTRIVGKGEIRNVDGYGVFDRDTTNSTVIDGLAGVSHGSASSSFTPHFIYHEPGTANPNYRNVRVSSFRNAAARITNLAAAMDNRYARFTANGTVVIPDGVSKVRCRAVGAGGGGGGAGSAAAAQLEGGGGGGAAGAITELEVDVVPGETLTVGIGTGGAGGGGGAAGGNAGSNGTVGGTTTVTNSSAVQIAAAAGGPAGAASTASSTSGGNAGLWGSQSGSTSGVGTAGNGGPGGSNSGVPILVAVGGGGGGAATATNGGAGGQGCLTANALGVQGRGSASGTSAGVNGVTATKPGCGGGGGGGGAAGTGAGGAGGAGADGLVEMWW